MIVVDTNVIGYLYLTSAQSGLAEGIYQKDPLWAAPFLWRSELRNVLAGYIRINLLSISAAEQIMDAAVSLLAGREYVVPSRAVLQLSARSTCSAYDCEFVALAEGLKIPLVTADQGILDQFPKIAVPIDRF